MVIILYIYFYSERGGNLLNIYLIIAVLLSLSVLLSLRYCLKTFDKLELIGLLIFCSGTKLEFFYFFSSAFKFVDLVEENTPLTILRLENGVLSPALLVWTLFLSTNTRYLWLKVTYNLIWCVITIAIQRYELTIGLMVDNNWTVQHELISRIASVTLVYTFMIIWHKALKRDKVIA